MRPHGVEKSYELYRRAMELIPGGTQLISRRPDRYAFGITPYYAERAKGCRFWDVDGNEYIDLQMAVGANVLGYADEVVDEAVIEAIHRGPAPSATRTPARDRPTRARSAACPPRRPRGRAGRRTPSA